MVDRANPYDHAFYESIAAGSELSARTVVPLALEFVPARSVCDVGCGTGTWLKVFREHGVAEVLGIDGDYVPKEFRAIPDDQYFEADLMQPIKVDRKFDLVISLEVAEHLPASCAASFVAGLTALAPTVLFSAAIPFQGGTNHVNEQWPEYWRDLFAEHDFAPLDVIRPRIWNDKSVEWWYRQNVFLYVSRSHAGANPRLSALVSAAEPQMMSVVHPQKFLESLPSPPYLTGVLKLLPGLLMAAVKRRLSGA